MIRREQDLQRLHSLLQRSLRFILAHPLDEGDQVLVPRFLEDVRQELAEVLGALRLALHAHLTLRAALLALLAREHRVVPLRAIGVAELINEMLHDILGIDLRQFASTDENQLARISVEQLLDLEDKLVGLDHDLVCLGYRFSIQFLPILHFRELFAYRL